LFVQRIKRAVTWQIILVMITFLFGMAACTHEDPTGKPAADITGPPPAQFTIISRDGVEIACPKDWQSDPDQSLVYCVSRSDYIRITVAVLSAFSQDYYEALVKQATVAETSVHGYTAYVNNYAYAYQGHSLITRCITIVQGEKACHIMILCDSSMLAVFEPIFDYVLDSFQFVPSAPVG